MKYATRPDRADGEQRENSDGKENVGEVPRIPVPREEALVTKRHTAYAAASMTTYVASSGAASDTAETSSTPKMGDPAKEPELAWPEVSSADMRRRDFPHCAQR
eukprot:CAMPEP_0198554964 /NCGR_PEP_ID=MMETSP1462-20131121/83746_1 /TAXON_ID=1333877 /ORGANISM="Brandtodinium nutriculum, Strain RCC3387" /LENGTH=103 /DNA_ID=CAMNT_0044285687 /DNA_START=668 /DNA_END=976 /DNA_ORIENTATION=-